MLVQAKYKENFKKIFPMFQAKFPKKRTCGQITKMTRKIHENRKTIIAYFIFMLKPKFRENLPQINSERALTQACMILE